jgi:hypothetical protein
MTSIRTQRAQRIAAAYAAGATLGEAGRAEGVSVMTAQRDLRALGIPARKPDPAPPPRRCAREGCDSMFRPTRRQLELGYGRFCSRECDHEQHRIYAKPGPRDCAHCGKSFTPNPDKGWAETQNWNRYCSRRCFGAAQRGPRQRSSKGQYVECGNCGRPKWLYDCELAIDHPEGRFCSPECHAEHRRRYPWPGYRNFLSPAASGLARQRVIGAREGRRAGRAGGRKRGYTDLQAKGVRRLRESDPSLGVQRLAKQTGLTVWQVRAIVAGSAESEG